MPAFRRGDVVKVPFPYADRPTRQYRPALVVAAGQLVDVHRLLWVVMITSAGNRRWLEDVVISDLRTAGLPAPSVIRAVKIATIEAVDASRLGTVPPATYRRVARRLSRNLEAWRCAEVG